MSQKLQSNLRNLAKYWAGEITKLSKSFAPNHLKTKISTHVTETNDGTFVLTTVARGKDARAQEHGSGTRKRDKRRRMEKYPIRPKTKRALAFYENAQGTWDYDMVDPPMPIIYAPDGRGVFFQVMHPGIQAYNNGEGYIRPAVKQLRRRARKDLDKAVYNAIFGDLNQAFKKGRG